MTAVDTTAGGGFRGRVRLGGRGRAILRWVIGGIALVAFAATANDFLLLVGGTVLIYAMSAVGLNWLMGEAGLVSLGNAALMATGAYTTAVLGDLPFPVPLLVSGAVGAATGFLVAIPALRLRGIYLALATLALQYFVAFAGDRYQTATGGASGLQVRPPSVGGYELDLGGPLIVVLGGCLGLTILVVRGLSRHAPGRMWNVIRESELAAGAIGVNVVRWKISAFVGSSIVVSVAGSLLAYHAQLVSSDMFSLDFAISFIVMLIIGGLGTVSGAVLGAAVVVVLPYLLSSLPGALPSTGAGEWLSENIHYINNGLYGVLVLGFLLYRPEGIAPTVRGAFRRRDRDRDRGRTPADEPRPERPRVRENDGRRPAALEIRDLHVTYSTGARAVDGLDVLVRPGEIVAVYGRNGAGKSSTLRAVTGFLAWEQTRVRGEISVCGTPVTTLPPEKTAAAGAVLVPERDKVFPSLTVGEHLALADPDGAAQLLERPYFAGLSERLDQQAGLLSGGERQLLALSVAALLRPDLLLVDEFSLGLAPAMIQRIGDVIRELRDEQGMSVLLVEQNAAAALRLADHVYLMEAGRIVAAGPPSEMADHELLSGVPGNV
ncbi:branched-chain amino acid ABC transporter ATP-binding protein/permease [Actinomadura vinacea]|uniref:Branched-chain amino acid ABC transporter ATP-binding protein/permease n=1 Tax=Actinomadura vinacea TaxID=115336 RepID=A0ABN3IHD2_9ACTN